MGDGVSWINFFAKEKMKPKSTESKTEDKTESDPIHVVVNDTMRIEAALNLSEAIKSLAGVIAGQTISVTIRDCTVNNASGAGISVGTRIDEVKP
jgi:hypothetical protein